MSRQFFLSLQRKAKHTYKNTFFVFRRMQIWNHFEFFKFGQRFAHIAIFLQIIFVYSETTNRKQDFEVREKQIKNETKWLLAFREIVWRTRIERVVLQIENKRTKKY